MRQRLHHPLGHMPPVHVPKVIRRQQLTEPVATRALGA
jgi:hypothetical protein